MAESYLLNFDYDPVLPEAMLELGVGAGMPLLFEGNLPSAVGVMQTHATAFELDDGKTRMHLSSLMRVEKPSQPDIAGITADILHYVRTECEDSGYKGHEIHDDGAFAAVCMEEPDAPNTATVFSQTIGGRVWAVSTALADFDPENISDSLSVMEVLAMQHTFALNALGTAISLRAFKESKPTGVRELVLSPQNEKSKEVSRTTAVEAEDHFDEFVGIDQAVEELRDMVRLANIPRTILKANDIESPQVALLYGPQGGGKTKLMYTLGAALGAEVRDISFSQVQHSYVGKWAANIEQVFREAFQSDQRVLIILDEMDGLTNCGNPGTTRTINAVLKRVLEEVKQHPNVFVIGAANDIDAIDEVVRADKRMPLKIALGLPNPEQRELLFRAFLLNGMLSSVTVEDDVASAFDSVESHTRNLNFGELRDMTDEFSAGDIREAVQAAKRAWALQHHQELIEAGDKGLLIMPAHADLVDIIRRKKITRP